MTEEEQLGYGAYGQVIKRDNKAIKKFKDTCSLIQEYSASIYLKGSENVICALGYDLIKKEIIYPLYNEDLQKWVLRKMNQWHERNFDEAAKIQDIIQILKQILIGLIHIHDKGMVHGDLKPRNILLNNENELVIADLGFISVRYYSKCAYCTPKYSESQINKSYKHDIYSFGIMVMKILLGNIVKTETVKNYEEMHHLTQSIKNQIFRDILSRIVSQDITQRPSAREILLTISGQDYHTIPQPRRKYHVSHSEEIEKHVKEEMKRISEHYVLYREEKFTAAIIYFLTTREIPQTLYDKYIKAMLYIMSSIYFQPHDKYYKFYTHKKNKHGDFLTNKHGQNLKFDKIIEYNLVNEVNKLLMCNTFIRIIMMH